MSQVINTNVMSLNAQRNLSTSGGQLAQSLERLSSGLRINSAKDDAAGLAISQRFTTQIQGLNQAIRNANDGISLAQTGEGALQEVSNNLQRIRELAVQAANATNSESDRAALNAEVQQRLAEMDRIASQTSFNGQKILDGSFGNAQFQVGANVGETITVELETSTRNDSMGAIASATSVDLGDLITEAEDAVATTSAAGGTFASVSIATGQEFTLEVDGVTVLTENATGATVAAADIDAALQTTAVQTALDGAGISFTGTAAGGNLVFSKADGTDFDIDVTNTGTGAGFSGADFATGTNTIDNGEEAEAAVPLTITDLTIQVGDNDPVSIAADDYGSAADLVAAVNSALSGNGVAVLNDDGTMSISASDDSITIGGADAGTLFAETEYEASGDLTNVNVSTVDAANDAIMRVDAALEQVSTLRGTFGAIQNRFESTIANLSATSENLSASRSRIMDTDFAAETAAMTRAQVLQQAGIAMLAQANAAPQNVLSLLR